MAIALMPCSGAPPAWLAKPRMVIRMSVVEGMSHSEIARATGIAIGTVKSHIFRGLAKVRARLAETQAAIEGSPS